jgi:hypothetical protein
VLTYQRASALSTLLTARVAAAAALSLTILGVAAPANAGGLVSGGCIGSWRSFSCVTRWGPAGNPFVRSVPQFLDESDQARAMERDRKWADRCRPVIRQDSYGVARYVYAAPACEFGVGEY